MNYDFILTIITLITPVCITLSTFFFELRALKKLNESILFNTSFKEMDFIFDVTTLLSKYMLLVSVLSITLISCNDFIGPWVEVHNAIDNLDPPTEEYTNRIEDKTLDSSNSSQTKKEIKYILTPSSWLDISILTVILVITVTSCTCVYLK